MFKIYTGLKQQERLYNHRIATSQRQRKFYLSRCWCFSLAMLTEVTQMDWTDINWFPRSRAWEEGSEAHALLGACSYQKEPVGSEHIRAGGKEQATVAWSRVWWGSWLSSMGHHRTDDKPWYCCVSQSLTCSGGPASIDPIRKVGSCNPLAPTLTAAKRWSTQAVKGSGQAPHPLLHITGWKLGSLLIQSIVATSTMKLIWAERSWNVRNLHRLRWKTGLTQLSVLGLFCMLILFVSFYFYFLINQWIIQNDLTCFAWACEGFQMLPSHSCKVLQNNWCKALCWMPYEMLLRTSRNFQSCRHVAQIRGTNAHSSQWSLSHRPF